MDRRMVLLAGWMMIMTTVMACSIAYEGINFTDDPEDIERQNMAYEMTEIAESLAAEEAVLSAESGSAAETAVPTTAPAASDGLPTVTRTETNTYSVQAVDYDCICSVNGDVQTTFNFKGDTMEILDDEGGATVFTKTGANTYSRTFMGYYILVDQAGNSTEVDEEKRTVIIFTDNGYTMEHYKGDSGSPCCVYTFTQK